jgi:predicted  nucleic acid-binding Zn-ribbon protein
MILFLCAAFDARAQLPEGSSSLPPEQWELTLDVIKGKAQSLMVENNGLQDENQKLTDQVKELQELIRRQKDKNEQMKFFLNGRHGRTDEQQRIQELTRLIKIKSQQAGVYDDQLSNLQKAKTTLDQNIRHLQEMISKIDLQQQGEEGKAQAFPPDDDQLVQLRKRLGEEAKHEADLKNQLGVWRLYGHLKKYKEELETKIYVYESRMEQLRQSSLLSMSWPLRKKKLVHDMVQIDARNNRMRNQIKLLREDVGVLKDQIAKLESRAKQQ